MHNFSNYNQLEKSLNEKLKKAMNLTSDEVFQILSEKVNEYYDEPVFDGGSTPQYERTNKLRDSLSKSGVSYSNNKFSFTVGFDDEYLSFTYDGWERRWGRGLRGKNRATGEDVLNYFNAKMHGGYGFVGKHEYWNEALEEIDSRGGLDGILKRNLKKLGVPIK